MSDRSTAQRNHSHNTWRHFLPQLAGLPLLPIGPGGDGKAPADPRTGANLKDWQTAAFSSEEVAAACSKITAVGVRPGPAAGGLIAFDIDGATAVALLTKNGCDPFTAPTWQVRRDTDPDRLKVIWRLPEELRDHLPCGVAKLTTKAPSARGAKDGENVATYYGAGQVLVLGQHLSSGGNYFWPEGHGPADLAEITPDWWEMALLIAEKQSPTSKASSSSTGRGDWRRINPCPICGRDRHAICSKHRDGRSILCFHGSTFQPPELKPGEVITGSDGEQWAFTGSRNHGDIGEFSHFKIDEPRPPEPDPTEGLEVIDGGAMVEQIASQAGPMGLAVRASKKSRTLTAYEVRQLLPERLGRIRRNVRTGEVRTDWENASGNETSRFYVHLCTPAEEWPKHATADAVEVIANANPYDPVRDYLEGIATPPLSMEQWQRLDQHLLGIDHPIAAAFLPRYFISAVARTMAPGAEIRQTPVLIGPQWRGKTKLGRILFGADHWEEGIGKCDRDAIQKAHTAWGVELAELDGVIRRTDPEKLKAFLTETCDTIQLKYDRYPSKHHRRFVFWGTANHPPLNDPTGSTRFVCIRLPDQWLPLEWAEVNRNGLWARALEQYRAGVPWDQTTEEERQALAELNSDFEQEDPWTDAIETELQAAVVSGSVPVKIPDLLERLGVEKKAQNNALSNRVSRIAARFGWEKRRSRNGGVARQGLWPPETASVHAVHGACTPRGVRGKPSDRGPSDGAVHPVHTSHQEKEEKEEGLEAPPMAAPRNAEKSFSDGVHGVYTPQSACSAGDQTPPGGCTEGCTEGCTPPPAEMQAKLRALRLNNPKWHPHQLAEALDPLGTHGIDEQTVRGWLLDDHHSAA